MTGIAEMVIVGRYALVLKFDCPKMELSEWTDRREKIQAFFGPGVTAGTVSYTHLTLPTILLV